MKQEEVNTLKTVISEIVRVIFSELNLDPKRKETLVESLNTKIKSLDSLKD